MTHGPQQMQGFEAILGRDGMVARRREELAEHLSRLAIVFDDQHVSARHSTGLYQVPYRLGRLARMRHELARERPIVSCFYAHDC